MSEVITKQIGNLTVEAEIQRTHTTEGDHNVIGGIKHVHFDDVISMTVTDENGKDITETMPLGKLMEIEAEIIADY